MAATSLYTVDEGGGHHSPARRQRRSNPTAQSAWRSSSRPARWVAVLTLAGLATAAILHDDVSLVSIVGVGALLPAGLVDLAERRLPNRMVSAAGALTCLAIAVSAVVLPSSLPDRWLSDLAIGAGLMTAPLLALHLAAPTAMGFGDVKAAVVLGACAGIVEPQLALVALFVASAGTAAIGLARRRRHLPFGPGLIIGTAVALLLSPLVLTPQESGEPAASTAEQIEIAR
jgi:leader peptidase (prepilin peptidase) / N-methyltransferase